MKQQGLAKTTFRKSYAVTGVLNAFQSYVNQQAGTFSFCVLAHFGP